MLQRQTLADGLARYLSQLGVERPAQSENLNNLLPSEAENDDDKPAAVQTATARLAQ